MPYADLREFIDRLRLDGELAEVSAEVDWQEEIGGIVRKNLDLKGPALLFKKIRDYHIPLFTCGVSTYQRLALALGLSGQKTLDEIVSEFKERIKKPIKTNSVKTGLCKENILKENEVDLLRFPVPLWQGRDGGRYLGTWHGVITRDPESGWTNAGMYRTMIHDRKILGILLARDQHIGLHYEKYRRTNRSMPVAIVIGLDPILPLTFLTPLPAEMNE
jgi:UbiD family decarboxylase